MKEQLTELWSIKEKRPYTAQEAIKQVFRNAIVLCDLNGEPLVTRVI